ncbi:MAG: type II toxin-antitoxin system RelE/ParE family toxin [Hymenobacter sp.]|nr:MAG: type II toxin-antitoxin system RelE/ParE family toxin [Hymenobacter sp.]
MNDRDRRKFQVEFLEEAEAFLNNLDEKARTKIIYNIRNAQITNDKELFKKLTDDIWEFRTLFNKTHYRLFAFWHRDTNTVVVATHGIIKKTDKTPGADLNKAQQLRKQYLERNT